MSLHILILAAGGSIRLRSMKQLVVYKNKPLINHAIELAQSITEQVTVVLGSSAENIQSVLSEHVSSIIHTQWQQGMGSSLRYGIQCLPAQTTAVLMMTCDQWRLEQQDLQALYQMHQANPQQCIASHYDSTIGIPAIFPRATFKSLLQCHDQGAKAVLQAHDPLTIALPNAVYDLDTPTDLQMLKSYEAGTS